MKAEASDTEDRAALLLKIDRLEWENSMLKAVNEELKAKLQPDPQRETEGRRHCPPATEGGTAPRMAMGGGAAPPDSSLGGGTAPSGSSTWVTTDGGHAPRLVTRESGTAPPSKKPRYRWRWKNGRWEERPR